MDKLRPIDHKILAELLKNSRRSDRVLAKALGISQPTITRRRAGIEKNFVDGYTAVPKWEKIGFEIVAFTFVKHNIKYAKPKVREETYNKVREWMAKHPNAVFAIAGQGMGWDGVIVSFHKNYSEFTEFIKEHNSSEFSGLLVDTQSFIANIKPANIRKPFHLKYLSDVI
jgi:DNA-binding Lrp family transcriptional regulator